MKLVREHINEKFEEDSDPIHDMGIGITALLKYCIENMMNIDSKSGYSTWNDDGTGVINGIMFVRVESEGTHFFVQFYSNLFFNNGKRVSKKRYLIKLLNKANLSTYLNMNKIGNGDTKSGKESYDFTIPVKEKYKQHFSKIVGKYESEHEKGGRKCPKN